MNFYGNASGDHASFTINGGTQVNSTGGQVSFYDESSAGFGSYTANGASLCQECGAAGGVILFTWKSTAGQATLIANGDPSKAGGVIGFQDRSDGSDARVEVFGSGALDTRLHAAPGVTIGSLEGDGTVILRKTLTVGTTNLSTEFSGVIQGGGGVTKVGSGVFVLSGANLYRRPTTVSAGVLVVNNTTGSGTGTGAVMVNAGTLGGHGTIAGEVQVTGTLQPGIDTARQPP